MCFTEPTLSPNGCGSKPIVPFWGLGCSLGANRGVDPWPNRHTNQIQMHMAWKFLDHGPTPNTHTHTGFSMSASRQRSCFFPYVAWVVLGFNLLGGCLQPGCLKRTCDVFRTEFRHRRAMSSRETLGPPVVPLSPLFGWEGCP